MDTYITSKKNAFLLITLIVVSCSFAQDSTKVIKKSGWALKLGSPLFIPTTSNYIYEGDESSYGVSDGYEYRFSIKPIITFGASFNIFHYNTFYNLKSSKLILGYGIGYKQSCGRVNYFGYAQGGESGNGFAGSGRRFFRQHYAQPEVSLYYYHNFNNKNQGILTGISVSADYLVRTNTHTDLNGKQFESSYSSYKFWAASKLARSPIQYTINYEIAWRFILNDKWSFTPTIKTALLNINRLLGKERGFPQVFTFENAKQKYSKEVIFGIIIMHNK